MVLDERIRDDRRAQVGLGLGQRRLLRSDLRCSLVGIEIDQPLLRQPVEDAALGYCVLPAPFGPATIHIEGMEDAAHRLLALALDRAAV